jgi:cysteinyl-tRNA synthetase
MLPLKLYNTLSRSVENFVPLIPGKASVYTCGPTVYHYAHIGNLRTYIFEDILTRLLRKAGYEYYGCRSSAI